jgi:hypothetical protein
LEKRVAEIEKELPGPAKEESNIVAGAEATAPSNSFPDNIAFSVKDKGKLMLIGLPILSISHMCFNCDTENTQVHKFTSLLICL